MNTTRFLFCVNSDDPDIVVQGLEEFRDQALRDHNSIISYGYHGRGSYDSVSEAFHPEPVTATLGVLASFIRSSPQLEELFVLWGLPGRDDDKPLSASHMSCLAVILHVAASNSIFCATVVNRILHEHSKSIISQLSSGNLKLVHSTLALILSMCRSSPQNCRDTFQKLVSISLSTFATLLQQGKTVTWDTGTIHDSGGVVKLKTDSRMLLIIIIFTAIEAADQSSGAELFSSNTSLLKRITNSIHKDSFFAIQLILESLAYLRKQTVIEQHIGSKLVDLRFQDNLLSLYQSDDSKIQRVVHTFLLNHSSHLASCMSKGSRGTVAGHAKASGLQLLKNLEGHRDLRHREVQMVLLKAQPSLMAKSISSVALATWEPVATMEYYCALSQLTFLCASVDVDTQFKVDMKTLVNSATADGPSEKGAIKADISMRGLTSGFLQAMIPAGFQKKDISKLLQHENALLQRSGLLYVLAVMQRLLKALNAAAAVGIGRVLKMEGAVAAAVHKLLPDFQLLLNIRSRYSKLVSESPNPSSEHVCEEKETVNESEPTDQKERTIYLLGLLLRIIECYIKTVPSLVSQAGFELTRLIDEVVPWSNKDSPLTAMAAFTGSIGAISNILGPVIRALRYATNARQCKWFGSAEDCVKLISQLVVMPDWDVAVKRTPLAKLLLLAKSDDLHEMDRELSISVRQLVRSLLKQSGIFQGHGLVDLELKTEQAAWLSALCMNDNSILIFDAALRITYHFNTEFCIEASDRIGKYADGLGYSVNQGGAANNIERATVVPLSPVMSCSINLSSNNFDIVASKLPRHIRVHVDPSQDDKHADFTTSIENMDGASRSGTASTTAFLSKYSNGFRAELHTFLMDVVMTSGMKARCAGSYGQCVLAAVDTRSALNESGTLLLREVIKMNALLSLDPSNLISATASSQNLLTTGAIPSKGKPGVKRTSVKDFRTGSPDALQGIVNDEHVASNVRLLRDVLERAINEANIASTGTTKRPRNIINASKLEASSGKSLCRNRLRPQYAVVEFVIQNTDKIVSCYSVCTDLARGGEDKDAELFLELLDTVGLFAVFFCCSLSLIPLGTGVYNWIAALALRLMNQSRDVGENLEFENKATIIIEAIRLLVPLSRKYEALKLSTESEPKKLPYDAPMSCSKRRTRSNTVDESGADVSAAIYGAVTALTSLVVELVRQTSCAGLIADALNSPDLLDGMCKEDLLGISSRQILCAAASAYFRRFSARARKGAEPQGHQSSDHVTFALWKETSDRLLTMQSIGKTPIVSRSISSMTHSHTHRPLQDSGRDIFSLGWMIQHFIDNPHLRSQFIDLALKDGQGHSLLDLSLRRNVAHASATFSLINLDDVSLSVLQSASVETLTGALKSFANVDMQNVINARPVEDATAPDLVEALHDNILRIIPTADSLIRNALCCATIGLGSSCDSQLPLVSTFISPLSLMRISLSKQAEGADVNNKIYQIGPLCPSVFRDSEISELLSVAIPICVGKCELALMEVVNIFMEYEIADRVVISGNESKLSLLHSIEDAEAGSGGSKTISSVCKLMSQSVIVGAPYTLCLLATYLQSQLTPEARSLYLKGTFAAIAICSSLPDVLSAGQRDENCLLTLWCEAYVSFIINLLDDFIIYLTTLEAQSHPNAGVSSHVSAFFALLRPLMMISIQTAVSEQSRADAVIDILRLKASEVRKKMNKWIKYCLKFGLHSIAVLNGLSDFFSACRGSLLAEVTSLSKGFGLGATSIWATIFRPKESDFYHPSLVLQMVVSHSKFTGTLRNLKQSLPNVSLLKLLLVLLSVSSPLSRSDNAAPVLPVGAKNNKGSVADQFLVSALLSMYQGTMSDSDRLILRIFHLLNNADKCPALCTLKPITLNSKKAVGTVNGPSGPIFGAILQQLVYPTLSQYPLWRCALPQPLLAEGLEAEKVYKQQYSILLRDAAQDWTNEEDNGAGYNDQFKVNEKEDGRGCGSTQKSIDLNTDSDEEYESESESEGQDSDTESILSILSEKETSAEWNCDDTDTYVPSVDILSACGDKVYDPCFWLPALHHSLMQQGYSVRQLANTGALSLVIAGISSRCPILRSVAMSSLQRILALMRLQTPDKDAGFRERPQLLLLLNFIRNALDSFAPSSSGPTQFPSVVSLFLSRAALHLLQPTHELYSKINKYLLSRPFCDFKDVPLYDLLLVDGDAQIEQASRLTTFRMVRDGLCTRWDHLNLCRKNSYNRLMLLFPILSKDSRAGHAVFDLLDKALGMQVSGRYLLERCSIVSWLQQMASPTNSLDIDTTQADAKASIDAHEKPMNAVVDDVEDDSETWKGKGSRSAAVRSQPSVLLAASPRLLSRVICLMRRALGAGYLLSAGSSGSNLLHLGQILLAINTIIDDVIAINGAGMTSDIPVEFFRQLVLLMWDYALADSHAGGEKSLAWGLERVYLLALSIQHSARSTGVQTVDDIVISLLSLLSFQTSSPMQELRNSNPLYIKLGEMMSACALKYLILQTGEKNSGKLYAISQSALNRIATPDALDSTSYHSIVNSLCQDKAKSKKIREVEAHWLMNTAQASPNSWEHLLETSGTNLSLLIHESWEDLAQLSYETMPLPLSLGGKLIICMIVKAILNIAIVSCRGDKSMLATSNIDPAIIVPLFPLGTARWALTMKAAFLQPSTSALNLSYGDANTLMRRVLSSSDSLPFNTYTAYFCDFQLTFRLTLICLGSMFDHFSSFVERTANESEILEAIGITLSSLLRMSPDDVREFKASADIFKCLHNNTMRNSAEAVDGYFFWEKETRPHNSGSLSPRGLVQRICSLALDMAAGVVSNIDRNITNTALMAGSTAMNSSQEDPLLLSEHLTLADTRHLLFLSRELNNLILSKANSVARFRNPSIKGSSLPLSQYFEPLPSKDKKPAVVATKRSTVLFDKSSVVWRLGGLGSRDRVLASMKAVQYAPLSGVQVHSDDSEKEESRVEDMGEDDDSEMNEIVDDLDDDNDEFLPISCSQNEVEMDWTSATDLIVQMDTDNIL